MREQEFSGAWEPGVSGIRLYQKNTGASRYSTSDVILLDYIENSLLKSFPTSLYEREE
jgi:hypothetical protein